MSFTFSGVLAPARRAFAVGVAALISSVCAVAQNFPLIPAPIPNTPYQTLYNPADGFVYAYTSNTYSNSAVISQIDPKTAQIVATTSLQQILADCQLAPAGDYLYVAGHATVNFQITRYHLPDFRIDAQFQLPTFGSFYGMAISPSDSHTYAIAADRFSRGLGVALYRDGVQIGGIVPPPASSTITSLIFASGSRLLALTDRGEMDLFINAGGLSWDGTVHTISNLGTKPHLRGNLLYTTTGLSVDINSWEVRGSFPATSPFDLSSTGDTGFYHLDGAIGVFSTANFNLTGTLKLPSETLWAMSTSGPNTLAVSMDKGIYLVPTSAISSVSATPPVPTSVAGQQIRELALNATGMTFDKNRQLVYLVTPGSVGQLGNGVVVLDPLTAAIQNYAYVGSSPSQIVMSDSGNAMHVALSGSRSVATLDPLSLSVGRTTPLGDWDSFAVFPPYFIAALPGSDTAFVASRNLTPFDILPTRQFPTTVAYDNGAPLPEGTYDNVISLAPGNTPGTVYQGDGSIFRKLLVGQSGIQITQQQPNTSGSYPLTMFDNNIYTRTGSVYQFGNAQSLGQFKVNSFRPTSGLSPDGKTLYVVVPNPGCFRQFCDVFVGGVPSQAIQIQAIDRQSLAVTGQYTFTESFQNFPNPNILGVVATSNEVFLNLGGTVVRVPLIALGLPGAPACVATNFSLSPNPSIGTALTASTLTGSVTCPYDIRSGSPSGPIMASGPEGKISFANQQPVAGGDKFYLQRAGIISASGTLATVTAQVRDPLVASCTVSQFSINPSPIFSAGSYGAATLNGNVGCNYDIRIGSPQGELFYSGFAGQFSATTGNWVTDNMIFYLQAQGYQTAAGTLSTVVAKVRPTSASGCTVSGFGSNPNPIRTNEAFGSTVLTGTVGCAYDIRVSSPTGALFATGQKGTISAATGNWVADGMMFYLQAQGDATDAGTLAVFTAKLQPAGVSSCSVHGLAANPNPIVASAGSLGTTTLTGASDCAFDIRIGSPDGDLFTTGGQGSFTAQTGAWVADGMKFFVQAHDDTTPMGTLSVVVSHVIPSQGAAACIASGFAVKDSPIRATGPTGTTVLTGNVKCAYDVRVGSASGALFTSGSSGAISTQTGNWVTDGMTFYLQPAGSTDPTATLAITTATLQAATPGCVVGGFTATPITSASSGSTTLTGAVACDYEIHVGSPSGALLTVGNKGPVSVATGNWASAGMLFYLQLSGNTTAQGTLAVAKVTAQQ